MEKVILDLDFNQGAIWISDQETGGAYYRNRNYLFK